MTVSRKMMINVENFLRKHPACDDWDIFALKFNSMTDVWNAMMRGEPDKGNAYDWALWVAGSQGVLSSRKRVDLALKFSGRIRHLMQTQLSIALLDIADQYARNKATKGELDAAICAIYDGCMDAYISLADSSAHTVICAAYIPYGIYITAYLSAYASDNYLSEQAAQMDILRAIPNPFE